MLDQVGCPVFGLSSRSLFLPLLPPSSPLLSSLPSLPSSYLPLSRLRAGSQLPTRWFRVMLMLRPMQVVELALLTAGLVWAQIFGSPRSGAADAAHRRQKTASTFSWEAESSKQVQERDEEEGREVGRNNFNNLNSLISPMSTKTSPEVLALQNRAAQDRAEAKQAKFVPTRQKKSFPVIAQKSELVDNATARWESARGAVQCKTLDGQTAPDELLGQYGRDGERALPWTPCSQIILA